MIGWCYSIAAFACDCWSSQTLKVDTVHVATNMKLSPKNKFMVFYYILRYNENKLQTNFVILKLLIFSSIYNIRLKINPPSILC